MRKKGLIRKIAGMAALSMALSCFAAFPSKAAPDEPTSETTSSEEGVTATTEQPTTEPPRYSVSPNAGGPVYESFKGMEEWRDRTVYTAPENTYALTISTGAKAGSSILYFDIKYRDPSDNLHSQFIFPTVDASERSEKLLRNYAGDAIDNTYGKKAADAVGYVDNPASEQVLGAWTTQDFAFQTEAEIESVEKIDLYMGQGSWAVQGLAIYSVDSYKGYEEYGLMTGQRFLDFEGKQICNFKKNKKSLTISTKGADLLIMLGSSKSGESQYGTLAAPEGEEPVIRKFSGADDLYSLRLDFADELNAGIESFVNETAETVSNYSGIVEDIAVDIQYKDTNGWTRKVTLPVILSSYASLMAAEPNAVTMGLAQRGDTVAFQGILPGYSSLLASPVVYVGTAARNRIAEFGLKEKGVGNQGARLSATATDTISLSGMSLYKGGCSPVIQDGTDSDGNIVPGATVEYAFENAYPMQYFTTTEERGRVIKAGGTEKIRMITYTSGSPIIASQSNKNKYMVTLYTSYIQGGGTKDDISFRFKYETVKGEEQETDYYFVKSAANDFLGEWPTTAGGNLLDEGGTDVGGKVSFMIDAPNVKNFTDVEIMVQGQDEWQMKNLVIDYVQSSGKRKAFVHTTTVGSSTSNYYLTRSLVSTEIFNLAQTANTYVTDENGDRVNSKGNKTDRRREQVFDSNGNPVYDDDGNLAYVYLDGEDDGSIRKLGDEQFIQGDETYRISFNTGTIEDIRDDDYSKVRYNMSFDQAHVNYKFFKKKKSYDVTVKVADDPDFDNGNGDSGSVNHFFFQLLFENGNSAFVLANQQLTSDGFRSGKNEVFTISTNQDYGSIDYIRIIPEDTNEDTDPFDKLNIERVTVTEQNNGGACMRYVFDQIGWISIDYTDQMEAISPAGSRKRTVDELAPPYPLTYKDRAVNLLVEMTNEPVYNDYLQFEGACMGEITYISSTTNAIETQSFDVVTRMANYMNKTPKSYDASKNNNITNNVGTNSISDPEWMFRPGTRDRFVIPAVADLKELKSISFTFQPLNGHPATINIGDINVSQVLDDGAVSLKPDGEYYRKMSTKKLCTKKDKERTSITVQAGMKGTTPDIEFTDNEIIWSSDDKWATPVSRLPESSNDTLNVFLFPTDDTRNIAGKGSSIQASVQFGTSFSGAESVSAAGAYEVNSGTKDAAFVITGLKASDFTNVSELQVDCSDKVQAFKYAFVQHVRDGVILETYEFNLGNATAIMGLTAKPKISLDHLDLTEETIAISFGTGTEKRGLIPSELDVAVSFSYTLSIDNSGVEYQSPYVYLTDQGYNTISEGLFAELNFDIPCVKEITGYRIVAYGGLTGSVEAACGQVYQVDDQKIDITTGKSITTLRSKRSYASFISSFELSENLTRKLRSSREMTMEGGVTPIQLNFECLDSAAAQQIADAWSATNTTENGENSTIDGYSRSDASNVELTEEKLKVMMIFKFRNRLGVTTTRKYTDITKYIQDEAGSFTKQNPTVVKFFIPEMDQDMSLISVDIYPYIGSPENINTNVGQMIGTAATVDPNTTTNDTATTQNSLVNANNELKIYGVSGDLGFGYKSIPRKEVNRTFNGREGNITLRFNDVVLVTYYSVNDGASLEVDEHRADVLMKSNDVMRCSVELSESMSGYYVHAYPMNASGAIGQENTSEVIKSADLKNFTFVAPDNTTTSDQYYKITITPKDAPTIVDMIFVTVEKNPEQPTTTETPSTQATTENKTTEQKNTEKPSEETPSETQQTPEGTPEGTSDNSTVSENPAVQEEPAPEEKNEGQTAPEQAAPSEQQP